MKSIMAEKIEIAKKHGIHITKGKKTQTKRIYNNGYLMAKYLYQPHHINFKNKMVNDINQHFCGGWTLSGLDVSNNALLNRVMNGEKPFGVIHQNEPDLQQYISKIDANKFDYLIVAQPKVRYSYLTIATKGKLKDLFDLQILKKDYANNGIDIDTEKVAEKEIKDYFLDWDDKGWLTGLILGYPIENTISLYLEGRI